MSQDVRKFVRHQLVTEARSMQRQMRRGGTRVALRDCISIGRNAYRKLERDQAAERARERSEVAA